MRRRGITGLVWAVAHRLGLPLPSGVYALWREGHEPDETEPMARTGVAPGQGWHPTVSIIQVPSGGVRVRCSDLLAGLDHQTCNCWELVVIEPDPGGVGEQASPRVRGLPGSAGETGACGLARCVDAARGELVVLLAADAVLPPWAVSEVVRVLDETPEADLVYGDADLLRGRRRTQPWFKPGWSPDAMLSANLFDPLVVVRRALLAGLALREGSTEGAALHWDLALRLAEAARHPVHVPKVLAHVRAQGWGAWRRRGWRRPTPATAAAAAPALAAHLQRAGLDASATSDSRGRLRVSWPVRGEPRVSLIIPTRDNGKVLRRCVDSILSRTSYRPFELLLLDNDTREAEARSYLSEVAGRPEVKVLPWLFPFNWSAINNFGASQATGELLGFLNNDMEVISPDWLEELIRWAQRPEVGVVGTLLVRADGSVQHAGVALGLGGVAGHPWERMAEDDDSVAGPAFAYRDVLAVTGACQMIRRGVFAELGSFDEGFVTLFSDVELCLRAWRRGYRVVHTPWARLVHYHGTTRGGDARMPPHDFWMARGRFGDLVAMGDPYLGPNLSPWSSAPCPRHAAEPDPAAWLGHLVEISRQQYGAQEARLPQPIRPLVDAAHAHCRGDGSPR
ncbi:MAG: glycosyltransferase family 2 protein [Thermoanaerobaculaceae bacterium]|nr:glycosyltransferase family 2 protein [Thermoanaerobaculaceae bacterium]